MPESLTVEVYPLREFCPDVYDLLDLTIIQYPIKKLYFIIPWRIESLEEVFENRM